MQTWHDTAAGGSSVTSHVSLGFKAWKGLGVQGHFRLPRAFVLFVYLVSHGFDMRVMEPPAAYTRDSFVIRYISSTMPTMVARLGVWSEQVYANSGKLEPVLQRRGDPPKQLILIKQVLIASTLSCSWLARHDTAAAIGCHLSGITFVSLRWPPCGFYEVQT